MTNRRYMAKYKSEELDSVLNLTFYLYRQNLVDEESGQIAIRLGDIFSDIEQLIKNYDPKWCETISHIYAGYTNDIEYFTKISKIADVDVYPCVAILGKRLLLDFISVIGEGDTIGNFLREKGINTDFDLNNTEKKLAFKKEVRTLLNRYYPRYVYNAVDKLETDNSFN
jgi:hypothetical protein